MHGLLVKITKLQIPNDNLASLIWLAGIAHFPNHDTLNVNYVVNDPLINGPPMDCIIEFIVNVVCCFVPVYIFHLFMYLV